jgi:hypothetical protein
VRSVHSKEAGREGSAPKSVSVAMPTPLGERKAAPGYDRKCEGRPRIAGVPSSGHVSKDYPRTQESCAGLFTERQRRNAASLAFAATVPPL